MNIKLRPFIKVIPTAAGLLTIPFIVKPIDLTIDKAMEMSVTKVLNGRDRGVSSHHTCPLHFLISSTQATVLYLPAQVKQLKRRGTGGGR